MTVCRDCGLQVASTHATQDVHGDCYEMEIEGLTREQIQYIARAPRLRTSISPARLFWTIFWALWAFSASAAIVVALLRVIVEALTPIGPSAP